MGMDNGIRYPYAATLVKRISLKSSMSLHSPQSIDKICEHWTDDYFQKLTTLKTKTISTFDFQLFCIHCKESHSFDNYHKHYRNNSNSQFTNSSNRHTCCILLYHSNNNISELYCFICKDIQYSIKYDKLMNKQRSPKIIKNALPSLSASEPNNIEIIPLRSSKRQRMSKLRGICNMGSTCFLSAVLQVIFNNNLVYLTCKKLFNSYVCTKRISNINISNGNKIIDETNISDTTSFSASSNNSSSNNHNDIDVNKSDFCIACELNHLIEEAHDASKLSISLIPSNLLYAVWIYADYMAGYEQQDAHEFYLTLLDGCGTHLRDYHPKDLSSNNSLDIIYIDKLFRGTMRSKLSCLNCDSVSHRDEQFLDISLSVDISKSKSPRHSNRSNNQELYLSDCLKHYTSLESLCEEVYCEKCQSLTKCQKQLFFIDIPQILVLHLKRFDAIKNKKNSTRVLFPLESLDLSPFMLEPLLIQQNLYDLCGVVNHKGGLNQGHYVAYVYNIFDNIKNWYRCDDDNVHQVSSDDVESSEGYLLFYMKRNSDVREVL